jgi:hypothetical protein
MHCLYRALAQTGKKILSKNFNLQDQDFIMAATLKLQPGILNVDCFQHHLTAANQ